MFLIKFAILVHFAWKTTGHAINAPNDPEIVKGSHFNQLDENEKEFISTLIRSGLQENKKKCNEQPETSDDAEGFRREVSKLRDLIGVVKEQQNILKLLQNHVQVAPRMESDEEIKNLQRDLVDLKQQMQGINPVANAEVLSSHDSQISEKLDKQQRDIEGMKQLLRSLMGNLAEKKKEKPSMQEMFYELGKIEKKLSGISNHQQNATWESNDMVGAFNPLSFAPDMKLTVPTFRNAPVSNPEPFNQEPIFARSTSEDIQTILSALVADREEKTDDSGTDKLVKELHKKLKRQKIEKQLKALEKELGHVESKSDVDGDSENLTKLLVKVLEAKSKPETKGLDSSVLSELRELEKTINSMSNSKNIDDEEENADFDNVEDKGGSQVNNLSNAELLQFLMNRRKKKGPPQEAPPMNYGLDAPSKMYEMYEYPESQYAQGYNRPVYVPQPIPVYGASGKYDFHEHQFFPMPQDTVSPNYQPQYAPGAYGMAASNQHQDNYHEIEDLKQQVYELQRDISNYNNADDKAIVYNLDKQMGELQNIIKTLQEPTVPRPPPTPTYLRPSVPQQMPPQPPPHKPYPSMLPFMKPYQHPQLAQHTQQVPHMQPQVAPARPMAPSNKPGPYQRYKRSLDLQLSPRSNNMVEDFNQRLSNIATQLELHEPMMRNNYMDTYNEYNPTDYADISIARTKKEDIFDKLFDKILTKILDKVSRAFPRILEFLFGKLDLSYGGYTNEGGLFGALPLLFMNIFEKIKSIVDYLQRHKLFRNFIVPFGTLGVVAGAVVFLVWWFQLQDDPPQIDYYNNYNTVPQNYKQMY